MLPCAAASAARGERYRHGRRLSGNCRVASVLAGAALCILTLASGCYNSSELPPHHFPSIPVTVEQKAAPLPEPGPPIQTAMQFADVTSSSQIEFVYCDGQEAEFFTILESVGGGAAAVDYDGDGRVDLICAGGGSFEKNGAIHGRLPGAFRNAGELRFTRVDAAAGLDVAPYYNHCIAAGDCDNDGFPDLLVTGYGGVVFYRNQGDGTFLEDARRAGLAETIWSTGAAWGDLNGDGCPDLYVAHYLNWSFANHPRCASGGKIDICGPNPFEPLPHTLYLSLGDGTFRDASRQAGLRTDGKGLGVLMADLDLDGRLDLYIANDGTPNFLYRNLGNLKLEEAGDQSGTSLNDRGGPDASMGLDIFDFNLDGLPDLWVTNFENEDFAVYRNMGSSLFRHYSRAAGITAVGTLNVGWGTVAADFDRDGDEDLFVTNGHASRNPLKSTVRQLPLLFENLGSGKFASVASGAGEALSIPHLGRGLAAADFDDDGDLDLALIPINEPVVILANDSQTSNHWLALKLIGVKSSRDAVGTIIRVETALGQQIRQVKAGGSFASTSDSRVFFGLGNADHVLRLEIRWPSGLTQVFNDVAADHLLRIIEDDPLLDPVHGPPAGLSAPGS